MMRRIWTRLFVATGSLLLTTTTALAADPNQASSSTINPGVRIGEWIYTNVTALFAPVLAVIATYYLVKREFTKFLSFAVFAVLAALLIFAGSDFKDSAIALSKWIIGK